MGSGKSTVGIAAAEQLGVTHFDTDRWVETVYETDIPSLLVRNPDTFRRLEAAALEDILSREPGVVSTGGGMVGSKYGQAILARASANIIWLDAPFDTVAERVAGDIGRVRPLFEDIDSARALYAERQPLYRATCTHVLDATLEVQRVVDQVISIAEAA